MTKSELDTSDYKGKSIEELEDIRDKANLIITEQTEVFMAAGLVLDSLRVRQDLEGQRETLEEQQKEIARKLKQLKKED